MTTRFRVRSFFAFFAGMVALACHNVDGPSTLRATLVTDSAQFTVIHQGTFFTGAIGFTLTNSTSNPISRAGCGGPGAPELQKNVDGRWVSAYDQISLACRTVPDFSWDAGEQMRSVLQFTVAERGQNFYPQLNVATIDGDYRLRWTFATGRVADAAGAHEVEAISNQFRLALAP